MPVPRPVLRTPLCDLLNLEYPILQSGMGTVAGPELAAEVSRAGGLGILAATLLTADEVRRGIRDIRARTDRPFGVNLLIPREVRPPIPAGDIPETVVEAAQVGLNAVRTELGLAGQAGLPAPPPDFVPELFELVLAERVPVFSVGLGNPGPAMVRRCHQRGIRILAMVTTVEDARAVEAAGVDAVVAQGSEAGGHRSHFDKPPTPERGAIGTLTLVPQIADAVRIPVIAAGGVADGRGLIAALALGASGVLLGTRFAATRESMAPEMYKKALLERSADATTVTDGYTGRYARVLENEFSRRYAAAGAAPLPYPWQYGAARDIYQAADAQARPEFFPMWAGQSVGLVHSLPGAAEVVEALVREARQLVLETLTQALIL